MEITIRIEVDLPKEEVTLDLTNLQVIEEEVGEEMVDTAEEEVVVIIMEVEEILNVVHHVICPNLESSPRLRKMVLEIHGG